MPYKSFWIRCFYSLVFATAIVSVASAQSVPTLTAFSRASAASLTPGAAVTFNYSVTNLSSSATFIDVSFRDGAGLRRIASQMISPGSSSVSLSVAADWLNGPYTIDEVRLVDSSGILIYYRRNGTVEIIDLIRSGATGPSSHSFNLPAGDFQVAGAAASITLPTLTAFSRASVASLTTGAEVTFDYSVTSGTSSLKSIQVTFQDSTGTKRSVGKTTSSGSSSVSLSVEADWLISPYTIEEVAVHDSGGRSVYYRRNGTVESTGGGGTSPSSHSLNLPAGDFQVTGAPPVSLPTLTAFSRASAASLTPGAAVTFNYSVTNGTSSVTNLSVIFRDSRGLQRTAGRITSSGTSSVSLSVAADWLNGPYTIEEVVLQDSSGKSIYYRRSGTVAVIGGSTTGSHSLNLPAGDFQVAGAAGATDSPVITQQPASGAILPGQAVAFTAAASGTAPLSFQWRKDGSPIAGATSASYSIANAQSSHAGSYTVVVSNNAGSATSNAAMLTVAAAPSAPTITTQPASQIVAAGANLNLAVAASGTAPLSFQWRKDGSPVAGATNATYSIPSAQSSQAGSYTVVVTNSAGSATSHAATLTVTAAPLAPTITVQPAGLTVSIGANATLAVVAVGTAPLSYQWRKDGSPIAGATNATYSMASAQSSHAGSYTVIVSNGAGSVTSSAAVLTIVTSSPPTISSHPASISIDVGQPVNLSVTATGSPAPDYQWSKNGTAIAGATSSSLYIGSAKLDDAGSYVVTVSNGAGSVSSSPATVRVTQPIINPARIVNLSILTPLASGETMTLGVVSGGSGTSGVKPLLIRAAGPSLTQFGVEDSMVDPKLELFSGQVATAMNDNWGGASTMDGAFNAVGAFGFAGPNSLDSAMFLPSQPAGSNTFQISGASGGGGSVIAEIYDSTPPGTFTALTPRLVNASVRKQMQAGSLLTAGFVIGGTGTRTILVRVIGPTLTGFGVGGAMENPKLDLYSGQTVIASNDEWGTPLGPNSSSAFSITAASTAAGAFALPSGSKDAALLVTLPPGSYTAQVRSVDGASGSALVELYEVP